MESIELLIGKISKGTYIPASTLEAYLLQDRGSSEYNFSILGLIGSITKMLSDRGEPATVVSDNYGIRVLTDPEASQYNTRRFGQHLIGMDKCYKGLLSVDSSGLTNGQDELHTRRLTFTGRIISLIKEDLKKIQPLKFVSYKSDIPKLFK